MGKAVLRHFSTPDATEADLNFIAQLNGVGAINTNTSLPLISYDGEAPKGAFSYEKLTGQVLTNDPNQKGILGNDD